MKKKTKTKKNKSYNHKNKNKKEMSTVSITVTNVLFERSWYRGSENGNASGNFVWGCENRFPKSEFRFHYANANKYVLISNCGVELNTDTAKTNFSHLICCQFHCHLHGNPLQRTSIGVDIFFSLILSYFCFFVAALRPCQGRLPRLKYMRT